MPFNPLVPFVQEMIPGFIRMEHRYLVAQTYFRGKNPLDLEKHPLLLSDYAALPAAKDHHTALQGDQWAAIIDLENPPHRAKLEEMASPGSPYLLFVAFVRDKKRVNARNDRYLAEAVKQYISRQTAWSPGRGETVRPVLELQYGELFLRLAYAGEIVKEKLSIFEQIIDKACVTTYPSPPPSEPYRITFQNSLSTLR
jgi:hypothetical protein